ncbi:hypothetical protein JOY44_00810 [Phormidium sp. CLA17]|uniref:M48 family metalloprotease n=1 Tax=Leptolyngbya sp. Cla-17 TaxID=2803751 RepID=UPI0018D70CF2|nr:hypothetical protein [Leptolyngbya sp. Cla-17]
MVKNRDAGALALPGGKVFISAGAIANANSAASLANVLARQIGHASLSHPMKLVNRTNSTNTKLNWSSYRSDKLRNVEVRV